jgi:SAM-dependent MidA family methyltransferase
MRRGGPEHLPMPDAEAQALSEHLCARIGEAIDDAGGLLPFDRYMELALYAPGFGYYSAGLPAFGPAGDFVTAPELGPLFARTLARQSAQVLESLGGGELLEFGGGSGALAAELLAEFSRLGVPLERYRILELSGYMRARQREAIAARAPEWLERVQWLDAWPQQPWRGMALGNEVLDAMPVRCFRLEGKSVYERGVARSGSGFAWGEAPASADFEAAVRRAIGDDLTGYPEGYRGELNLQLGGWFAGLAENFECGAALLIDYGDAHAGRYHPSRAAGTLRAYYRQHVLDDPFWFPGLCDLTSDVDFSAVAAAAEAAGFGIAGFAPQAQMLLGGGLETAFAEAWAETSGVAGQLRLAQEVKRLTLPDEMGERFRAIALSRGEASPPPGFDLRNLRDRL